MAVRVGSIDLVGLSDIRTEDARSLVEHRGLGQAGSVFQDLGREPVTIVMEGLLIGEDTQGALEQLREAQASAKPLAFAADAVAGADLTDVIIADLQVKQLAGHKDRYRFLLKVREHTEPPEPANAGAAAVQQGAMDDAAAWSEGALDASAVLQEPGSLMAAVEKNPGLLSHLSAGELGGIVGQTQGSLSGQGFGQLLGALGQVNPAIIGDFIGVLQGSGNLGDFVQKLAAEGVNVLSQLTGVDLGAALSIVKAVAGAGDFLSKLKQVVDEAEGLAKAVRDFDPLEPFQELGQP